MKKYIALLLIITLLLSLTACQNNKEKVERYCWNCGEGISKEVSFCGYCGVEVHTPGEIENNTEVNSSTQGSDSLQKPIQPQSTQPQSTQPQATQPQSTQPQSTQPQATQPQATQPQATQPQATQPQQPVHTHSYSKQITEPTCTEKGYTTFTCSCGDKYIGEQTEVKAHNYTETTVLPTCTTSGYTTYTCSCGNTYKDNYTNPAHTYTNYICHPCGAIDKANAHEHLVKYVKANGTANGTFVSITIKEAYGKKYELKYDAQSKLLWLTCRDTTQYAVLTTGLVLEDGYYGLNYVYDGIAESNLTGFIDPKEFNENSAMTYESYTGLDSTKNTMLNLANSSLVLALVELERYLDTNNVGLYIYALGYMGLQ